MLRLAVVILLSIVVFYAGYRMAIDEHIKRQCNRQETFPDGRQHLETSRVLDSLSRGNVNRLCPSFDTYGDLTLYKHVPQRSTSKLQNFAPQNGALQVVFSELHHPDSPARAEIIVATTGTFKGLASRHVKGHVRPFVYSSASAKGVIPLQTPYSACTQVYLTRSGSRESMPNKCVATIILQSQPHNEGPMYSPWFHSHRYGYQAKMRDMYSNDWPTSKDLTIEESLLRPVLSGLDILVKQLLTALGDPLRSNGSRRAAIVMVANEGVMDLLLNFICSARAADVDLSSVVVFLGQPEYAPLVESMGANAIYHPFYGDIPKEAAGSYGDKTFGKLMWLKTTSVYVTQQAGFDVIFQDADLVWMQDPVPLLHHVARDFAFMDDGARSTRFTPFFVNSGFYFFKRNKRTQYMLETLLKSGPSEISVTHSHQAALTRHLTEAHHLAGLHVDILDSLLFPSGAMYHNNKTFIAEVISHQRLPVVFHMCWTASRTDKVKYFKELGMWFLPTDGSVGEENHEQPRQGSLQYECEVPAAMLSWVQDQHKNARRSDIRAHCCQAGSYFREKKKRRSMK